ncbi:MAG UNVERIFIED_CONTAM: ankyrin repeat domain-containing protein [Microcystis novacekii LVE1205-3]|jgi:ankyrin repeat protein
MGMQPSIPIEEESEPEVDGESACARLRNAAATAGVLEMKSWIEQGANLNAADDNGQTALHFCADRGMLDGVVYLLQLGANPNAADQDGISVLQAAVIAGHVEICKILLEAGANPDHEDSDGDTPRSCANEDPSEKMVILFANY